MYKHSLALTLALTVASAATAAPSYQVTGKISAADGGWDYADFDAVSNHLFVARGDRITSVDVTTGQVTDKLAAAQRAHEVLPIPGTGAVLQTDGTTNSARLIDIKTGAVRWSVMTGEKPDAAIWDAKLKRAIVMHNKGGTIALVDPETASVTGSARLKPGLEGAVRDKHGVVWVNNEESNDVTPVFIGSLNVLAPVKLTGCDGATGIAYAARLDQVVSACGNGVAVVTDAKTHTVIATLAIGKGADAAMIDEKRGVILIPCGRDGVLSVLDISGAAIKVVTTVPTEKGARTGALDPATGKVYLPTANFAAPDKAGERPKVIPGSFHILVVSPSA